ncbi:hypothetical protein VTK73DRAFT_3151 [Phialemonium thermophilum]|uniref:Uncharacterized protein n=1 Tax=Phialemonium thermophilum TaxID=223376 RepID=A0ABR3VKA1_9PEZI
MDFNEKTTKASRDLLNIFITVTRLWQWASSLTVYVFVTLLLHQNRTRSSRVRTIQPLILVTLVYSTVTAACVLLLRRIERLRISSWHIFAMTTIPGDLLILSVFVAKVAVLSIQYFECAVVSKTHGFEDLVSQDSRHRIPNLIGGPHSTAGPPRCHFPTELYSLCIVAIFTYILSLLFTILQLWRRRQDASASEDESYPPLAPPPNRQRPCITTAPGWIPPMGLPPAGESSSRGANQASTIRTNPEPKYANMPDDILAGMTVGRLSQETTSSFDPDLYLVSDGFQMSDDPPAYTSRPSSLYGLSAVP